MGSKHCLVAYQATAWVSVLSECDLNRAAWLATQVFGKWWGLQRTVFYGLLCGSILKGFIQKPKVTAVLLSDGVRSILQSSVFGLLGFEWRRWKSLIKSTLAISRCSVNICGYDPLTLEISWGSELHINSKDRPFILWVMDESGSQLPTSCSAHHSWRPNCSSASGTSFGRTYLMSSWRQRRKWKMGLSETAFA